MTGERRQALIDMVDEWVRDEKVEDGRSDWCSPTFVVAKEEGKWRGVVEFRAMNEATITDAHPLPRIEDILVQQGQRAIYSVLDMKPSIRFPCKGNPDPTRAAALHEEQNSGRWSSWE